MVIPSVIMLSFTIKSIMLNAIMLNAMVPIKLNPMKTIIKTCTDPYIRNPVI